MALFQRDAAINERNSAIIERDNAIAALEYSRGRNISHHHHHQHQNIPHSSSLESSGSPYNHRGEVHINEQINEPKAETVVSKKSKQRKNKRSNSELNNNLKPQDVISKKHRKEWKVEDLGGLNEVVFDESSMPVPVCSCTGKYQPCYKWGNGGWQSACCTTTISMYPLPVMPNKRHARVNGRKMSGSVFTKLLSKLASEGHDLSMPLDLKDHWSKHGTNRYITIK
ncbi:uncharacterized protein A4U43_C01F12510 [Asparagus officinalis]|uniref:GAGA-binding transcriptional activator n=1 Tax=Asparagus officinalis TaxID=4686 RepID=A0A5P1FQI4_ASPOF|nr:uncharacterized protein A4U43_C01F12510 [Asparagus officinalis]